MSYILDALRRAEADRERERGQVPGLHAPPLAGPPPGAAAGLRRGLPWVAGGLLLVLGVVAGSWWAGGAPESTPPSAPSAPVAPARPAAPAAPAVAVAPAAPVSPTAPVAPVAALPPPPAVAPSPAPAGLPAARAPAVAAAPAVPAPPPAAEARPPRLADLPEALRRDLPRLSISGSVYSDDPASRFVIVNGEVVREGARLGPDLVLEQIQPHELVLRFRGQRYRQPV